MRIIIPRGYKTAGDIRRQIADIQETQECLRREIDRMPDGPERECKIDALMAYHQEIEELHAISYTD